jgi:1-acyl-sn-glycerol-3-phosphate acyltransferase
MPMHRFFIQLFYFIQRNKVGAALLALAYLLILTFYISRIQFDEDITRLIPKSKQADETTKILENLQFSDKITVIFSEGDQKEAAVDHFLEGLDSLDTYIKSIQGKFTEEDFQETFESVQAQLPFYLNAEDYSQIQDKLQADSLKEIARGNFRNLSSPGALIPPAIYMSDPLGMTFLALQKWRSLAVGSEFIVKDGYLSDAAGKKLFLFLDPTYTGSETKENQHLADGLYALQSETEAQYGVKIHMHGAALIAVANAEQIKRDILTTVALSFTALMLILILYYRKVYVPLLLFLPTAFGVLLAISVLYLVKDTLSAISLSIGAILLGVTVDYALHILSHYKTGGSIEELYKDITRPLIMSASTTAVAFLCLLFVGSEALKDLGIFAAVAVVASAVFSLVLIPHLYTPGKPKSPGILDRLAHFSFEKSKPLIGLSLALILLSIFTFSKVGFNEDISQLNYIPEEIRNTEKILDSTSNLSAKSLYLVNYSVDKDSAIELSQNLAKHLNNLPILSQSSPSAVVLSPNAQAEKVKAWEAFWSEGKKDSTYALLRREGEALGLQNQAYSAFYALLSKKFTDEGSTDALLQQQNIWGEKDGKHYLITVIKIEPKNRDQVVERLSGYKNLLIVDRQALNEAYLGQLKTDFNRLINYSFLAVLLILWLFFKRIELVLLASIPIGLTALVTGGLMGLLGLELNIFSSIVCTLIFGHGVDFSIFMTAALQKEYTYGKPVMPQYRISVLLAVLTTVLAIGALIFAEHPALRSISAVSLCGVLAAVLITFVFYPLLFKVFITWRPEKGIAPFRLVNLLISSISFTYYGLGSLVLSFVAVLYARFSTKDKPMRRLISGFMASVLKTNPILQSTKLIGREHLNQQSIWIANHSSFLDILSLGGLHSKAIFLVSDWVYNSPLFGKGVQNLGFYPVSEGLENGLEKIKSKVDEGFSIIIFPEGTRSRDNSIKRFHKGAFYLSEYLNLPLQPVLIHGPAEALPKGDFLIRKYPITLKFLPPIPPSAFPGDLRERTRKISTYFKQEFRKLRKETENETYFYERIFENFIYKESDVVTAAMGNLKKIGRQIQHLALGENSKILHISSQYGEIDLLLHFLEAQRKVDSYILDPEKRAVAENLYLQTKVQYLSSLPESPAYDVLLITGKVPVPESYRHQFPKVYEII